MDALTAIQRRLPFLLLLLCACSETTPSLPGPGYEMQVRVDEGTLHEGPLVANPQGPRVTQILYEQTSAARGDWGIRLTGRVSAGAVAVYIAAQGDPNHWVLPAKGFDFTHPDELQWSATLSFSPTIPPGDKLRINLQAVDKDGALGPIRHVEFDLEATPPPSPLVVALDWNRMVDFDLMVMSPDGLIYGPAKRSDTLGPNQGPRAIFAFDSNQECKIDARNHEDLVWQIDPIPGHYLVFVDLFSNCDEPASNYQVNVIKHGVPWLTRSGVQYAVDASWPATPEDPPGELVLEFDLP